MTIIEAKKQQIKRYKEATTKSEQYAAYEEWNKLNNLEYWCQITEETTNNSKSSDGQDTAFITGEIISE